MTKIEVAPWIEDYVVDMEELYTEVVLEKIHNKPQGEETTVLSDYKELFTKYLAKRKNNSELSDLAVHDDDNTGFLCFKRKRSKQKRTNEKDKKLFKRDYGDVFTLYVVKSESVTMVRHKGNVDKSMQSDRGEKILVKGDPGMGKTTWSKKVAWDWTQGFLTTFSVVFFVFLKLVKPGSTIENIIIEQNSCMTGLKISDRTLGNFLETFGNRCLLILDGLHEHALGTNQDVLKIIRGEKMLSCNIIVTSRPHSTKKIAKYFPVIIRIGGFTYCKAEQFASKILSDRQKVVAVLKFNPAEFRNDVPVHRCPILLSFLCLLVKEDEINLSTTDMHIGEIYFRMVRCLYKKFTIRKGTLFRKEEFIRITTLIGKLAFDTLLTGNPLLQRSHVMSLIGQDAFDYGLLIGHEDFRLIRDETADIFISFPHRSLQEFVGALYFIWTIDEKGQSVFTSRLDKSQVLLTNPLFLQFCLWFLNSDEKYQFCKNASLVYADLTNYYTRLVNHVHLDAKHIAQKIPTLDLADLVTVNTKDELRLRFLRDILTKCDLVSHLSAETPEELAQVLTGYPFVALKFITCGDSEIHLSHLRKMEVGVKLGKFSSVNLNILLKRFTMDGLSVHLNLDNKSVPLDEDCGVDLRTLHMDCKHLLNKPLRSYWEHRHLTHLRIKDFLLTPLKTPIVQQLSATVEKGGLQCLTHLNLSECTSLKGTLRFLFETLLPEIQHINLVKTRLGADDLRALCLACNGEKKTLPKLTSLCLSLPYAMGAQTVSDNLFALPWPHLKQLYQYYNGTYFADKVDCLLAALKENKLPNLGCLGIESSVSAELYQSVCTMRKLEHLIFHNCDFIMKLLLQSPMQLTTLVLSYCELTSQDLSSLAQAAVKGRLPELKHLDLSNNKMTGEGLMSLFDTSCPWNQLLSLDIGNNLVGRSDITCAFMKKVETNGLLGSLHELGIDDYPSGEIIWPDLKVLYFPHCSVKSFRNISEAVNGGCFPSLRTICVKKFESYDASLLRTLQKRNIYPHKAIAPFYDPLTRVRCYCQITQAEEC